MAKSVTEPISFAFERTTRMLFKPFNLTKWLILGFAAWLAQLGDRQGGGGGNIQLPGGFPKMPAPAPPPIPAPMPTPPFPPMPGPGPSGTPMPSTWPTSPTGRTRSTPQEEIAAFLAQAKQFILANLYWIVPVAILALIIGIVVLWLRARGKFMFLDGVANDRAAIVEPWKRLAPQANSFFRFQLLLGVLLLLWIAALGVALFGIALPDFRAQSISGGTIAAIAVAGMLFVLVMLLLGFINALADDFLVPIMYVRETSLVPAWREFRQQIVPGNVGSIVLFYGMRIVLGIATAVLMGMMGCLLCFIAVLPYLGTVLFLPIYVFHRNYVLYFLRQFGPDYNLIVDRVPEMMSAFPVIMPPPPPAPPVPPEGTPPPDGAPPPDQSPPPVT